MHSKSAERFLVEGCGGCDQLLLLSIEQELGGLMLVSGATYNVARGRQPFVRQLRTAYKVTNRSLGRMQLFSFLTGGSDSPALIPPVRSLLAKRDCLLHAWAVNCDNLKLLPFDLAVPYYAFPEIANNLRNLRLLQELDPEIMKFHYHPRYILARGLCGDDGGPPRTGDGGVVPFGRDGVD